MEERFGKTGAGGIPPGEGLTELELLALAFLGVEPVHGQSYIKIHVAFYSHVVLNSLFCVFDNFSGLKPEFLALSF